MPQLSSQLPWELANSLWSAVLNPLLAIRFLQGRAVPSINLITGVTIVNHGLQRMPIGWYITDINGSALVYRSSAFTASTLTLTSSATVNVSLWVF